MYLLLYYVINDNLFAVTVVLTLFAERRITGKHVTGIYRMNVVFLHLYFN